MDPSADAGRPARGRRFLLEAAVGVDPRDAVGLDGVLRELAEVGEGRILLHVTAVGFVLAGAYDMTTIRRQRLE